MRQTFALQNNALLNGQHFNLNPPEQRRSSFRNTDHTYCQNKEIISKKRSTKITKTHFATKTLSLKITGNPSITTCKTAKTITSTHSTTTTTRS